MDEGTKPWPKNSPLATTPREATTPSNDTCDIRRDAASAKHRGRTAYAELPGFVIRSGDNQLDLGLVQGKLFPVND
jgi:hypothetical protein